MDSILYEKVKNFCKEYFKKFIKIQTVICPQGSEVYNW